MGVAIETHYEHRQAFISANQADPVQPSAAFTSYDGAKLIRAIYSSAKRETWMKVSINEGLGALERIIAKAEERRVDTMIQIALLEADDLNSTEAHTVLAAIEKLLKTMRKQRRLLAKSVYHDGTVQQDASLLCFAA